MARVWWTWKVVEEWKWRGEKEVEEVEEKEEEEK